jgi:hypothetical protein
MEIEKLKQKLIDKKQSLNGLRRLVELKAADVARTEEEIANYKRHPTWVTRNGVVIHIDKMTNSHLINSLLMMARGSVPDTSKLCELADEVQARRNSGKLSFRDPSPNPEASLYRVSHGNVVYNEDTFDIVARCPSKEQADLVLKALDYYNNNK